MLMPSLGGATEWMNSDPLGAAALRGRAVLVDFCTYTCINWLRQEPYVRAWSRAYRDDGLVVIGVHTPEFSFEHEIGRVRRALAERDIDYPVAIDNDYEIWDAFGNRYWPALYFVDGEGVIRDRHFGEGRYEESERVIQGLVGVARERVPVEGVGVEAEADWENLRTPETYLGHRHPERLEPDDTSSAFAFPERLRPGEWGLSGKWTIGHESVVLGASGGSIAFRFHARDAHLVMSPGTRERIPFRMLLDGAEPGSAHGEDVGEDGRGIVREGRLYQLVRQREEVRERTVEIEFETRGAEAFVFTFG